MAARHNIGSHMMGLIWSRVIPLSHEGLCSSVDVIHGHAETLKA